LVFIKRRKGFKKLFEDGFDILEKEKKMEISPFSVFGPKAQLSLLPLLARLVSQSRSPTALLLPARRVVGWPNRPKPQAASPFSLSPCVTATPGPRNSVVVFLL
jgi:hypothetical protein